MSLHKYTNSFGIREAYKNYQSVRLPEHVVSEKQYYAIIREFNQEIINTLITENEIRLPGGLGTIYLAKTEYNPTFKDGKLVNLPPVNWKKTKELWEDPQYRESKTLVRNDITHNILIKYSRKGASLTKGKLIFFRPMRSLRKCINNLYKEGIITEAYSDKKILI